MHVSAGPVFNDQGVVAHPPMQVSEDQIDNRKRELPGRHEFVRGAPRLKLNAGARREHLTMNLMAPTDEEPRLARSAAQYVRRAVTQRLAGHVPKHLIPTGSRMSKSVSVQAAKPGHRHAAPERSGSAGLRRGVTAGRFKAQQVTKLIGQSRHWTLLSRQRLAYERFATGQRDASSQDILPPGVALPVHAGARSQQSGMRNHRIAEARANLVHGNLQRAGIAFGP